MGIGLRTSACVCAVVSLVSLTARAAVITIPGSIDDYEAQRRSDTGVYVASENFATGSRIGFQSNFNGAGANQPGGITSLYSFRLPVLAANETLTHAAFSVGTVADSAATAATAATPTFNADLYALGVVNSIPKTAADAQRFFYLGRSPQTSLPAVDGAGTVSGSVQRLVDDFLTPGAFIANGGTAGPAIGGNITSYVQNLYANPAANGFTPGSSYLVLRLSPDADPIPTSGTQRYTTAFEGTTANGGSGTPETRPQITYTVSVVPEPAAAGLLILGAGGLLRRRRSA